jgi:GNAT superfamily N-acetyltransferase
MAQRAKIEVVRLKPSQFDEAVELLARAFHDQPYNTYSEPDPTRRMYILRESFRCTVCECLAVGEPYGTGEELSGVALWMPPGVPHISKEQEREFGFDRLPAIFGETALARHAPLGDLLKAAHERNMTEPHWFLHILGVDPARQGEGIGSALMEPVLRAADSDGLPCYLDTAQPRNVPFYQRHGFRILVEDVEPVSGLRYWTFRREPKRRSA